MIACIRTLLVSLALLVALDGATRAPGGPDTLPLPPPETKGDTPVERALQLRRSTRRFAPDPLGLGDAGQVLWAAQGVTHPSGYRTVPSAGALHPLEVYLVVGRVAGLPAGVYRYQPAAHALARVRTGDVRAEVAAIARGQSWMRDAPAMLVIAAVHERSAARYGNRAQHYVSMEAGHAAQNVYLQCTARGLATVLVGAFDDDALRTVLGLPADHAPLALMPFGRPR